MSAMCPSPVCRPPRSSITTIVARGALACLAIVVGWIGQPAAWGQTADEEAIAFFESQVRPILERRCFECHGPDIDPPEGNLLLASRRAILAGGNSGPAVNLDAPASSLLVDAINYGPAYQMPPDGRLPREEIETLTRWVELGLPWTPSELEADEAAEEHRPASGSPPVDEQARQWWSFQPLRRLDPPAVSDAAWPRNPIDNFILAHLDAQGLRPVPPADPRAMIRRAYYDLIGLPPEPAEVEAFANDSSPDAYERLIDRLLASPHYGEKWGRHWLDLVRYAESNSFERDGTKPHVWRYRDYVIRSFNDDKPFDLFVTEQLAGDELDEPSEDAIIATGYYRLGQWDDEPADPLQAQYDELDDILTTTTQTLLGLTVNCARCHDHKIDPIPQADYYQMLAFFRNIRRYGVRAPETVMEASVRRLGSAEALTADKRHTEQVTRIERQLRETEALVEPDLSSVEREDFRYELHRVPLMAARVGRLITAEQLDEYKRLRRELKELRAHPPEGILDVLCVKEEGATCPPTHVLMRGNPHVEGPVVEPAFLSVLSPPAPAIEPSPSGESSGRRLALARWLTSPDTPLTARVLANRLWQHHFGRGIVRSANDFGYQGTPPTHPELLDWLASELVAGGWRLKRMHKLIMMSSAYRMSSAFDAEAYAADPRNDHCWRFDPRRLSAEELRDSILAANGTLDCQSMFGPSFYPTLPREVLQGQSRPGDGWETSPPEEQTRRSIYIHVKRSLQVPLLANFDVADTDFTCPVRFQTTQPTQALGMLNSRFINEQARLLADYARQTGGDNPAAQVELVLERVTQRPAQPEEIETGLRLIAAWQTEDGMSAHDALTTFCVLAYNLNEFVYLD